MLAGRIVELVVEELALLQGRLAVQHAPRPALARAEPRHELQARRLVRDDDDALLAAVAPQLAQQPVGRPHRLARLDLRVDVELVPVGLVLRVEVDLDHRRQRRLAPLAVAPREVEVAQGRARVVLVAREHALAVLEARLERRARGGALGVLEQLGGLLEAAGAAQQRGAFGDGRKARGTTATN